jgi:hypothetical protein
MDTIEGITVSAPLFLISTMQPCNLCGNENMVAALATNNLSAEEEQEEEGFLLSYVEDLPAELLGEILKRQPNFAIRHSMTAGDSYFMTVCECGGQYGDHYVHKQLLNQAFRAPDEITVQELPLAGTWVIPCAYSQSISVGELLDLAEVRAANL